MKRPWPLLGGCAVLVAAAIVAFVLARQGTSTSFSKAAAPAAVRAALISRLHAQGLNYRWVVCVHTGRSFRGSRVLRCNVDFGEPHIVAYCSTLEHGRFLTNYDTPSLTCPPDRRGWSVTVVTG